MSEVVRCKKLSEIDFFLLYHITTMRMIRRKIAYKFTHFGEILVLSLY